MRWDLQNLCQLEQNIKRNTDLAQFNGTDIGSVDVHQLSQLGLGIAFFLSVVDHIQSNNLKRAASKPKKGENK